MLWRRRIEPFTRPVFRAWWRLTRGMTLGVRGVVLDPEGRVLLVEHTYVRGWHLPGGGVERGESAQISLARELVEEAGVRMTGPPMLAAIHDNGALFPGDHVLVFLVDAWEPCPATSRGEIHSVGWFEPDDLPAQTSQTTRALVQACLSRPNR